MIDFHNYIEIDAKKRFGKPVLMGTWISVYEVPNANDLAI